MLTDNRHQRAMDIQATRNMDVDVLARTIWGEARGECHLGKVAVANVVMNRVKKQSWMGRTISTVCLKPRQFSCWLESDPNRLKLMSVQESDKQFVECLDIAKRAVSGALADVTGGATHYMVKDIQDDIQWDNDMIKCAEIGAHVFFREA